MKVILDKKPKSPVIIEGFPGFGLVGTITTEFLIRHLKAKEIGRIRIKEVPPVIAVHEGEPVEPLGIFHDPKTNIVILHALTDVKGIEWALADAICKLAKDLKATEVISVEGIGSSTERQSNGGGAFFVGDGDHKKLAKAGAKELREGIIMGVSGALLVKKHLKTTFIFAETVNNFPDARASAKIIEVLDKYLGLKVDPKPLIKKAEDFEKQLRELMDKAQLSKEQSATKKNLSYLG